MKHVTVMGYGTFLGLTGARLCIYEANKTNVKEIPLNQIKTLTVTKKGMSISTDLILELGARGIKLFFISGKNVVSLSGTHQHAVAKTRQYQIFHCNDEKDSLKTAQKVITAKVKNQRATLLYYAKHHAKKHHRPPVIYWCQSIKRHH